MLIADVRGTLGSESESKTPLTFTFSHLADAFVRRTRKCKTTPRKEVRGIELATLQLLTVAVSSVPVHTCCQVIIHRYYPINIPTHLAFTAVVVLNFAMIMVLYSS